MTNAEIQTIRNVIARLKGDVGGTDEIRELLKGDLLRIYLDSWIIGALECLLPGETRDPRLAVSLSACSQPTYRGKGA